MTDNQDATELVGIRTVMSRAVEVAELKDYIGKKQFENQDRAVFTSIKRTMNPLNAFTYEDIQFVCKVEKTTGDVESVAWSRDKSTGATLTGERDAPDRIYWTDATNDHTFIGYCAPQQRGGSQFDWKKITTSSGTSYYGSIGDPTEDGPIDFRSIYDNETQVMTTSGNEIICQNDILLTHSTEIKASNAVAALKFYHGLAQVRVIVNISEFAASDGADTATVISDMELKEMLTLYKWKMADAKTQALVSLDNDAEALPTLYPGANVSYDQRKNMKLWIPNPKGVGVKANKTFTFYGLAVPTEITSAKPLEMVFNVTYPNPMKPEDERVTHQYSATISDIRFDAGKCTTINIALNHKNEKLTVGAEYQDWEYIDIPDYSVLKKRSTFLNTASRDSVTIVGDQKANIDDATWLYLDDKSDPDHPRIVDVYGNTGTSSDPFVIKSANQLLSLAYEVNGTNRRAFTYYRPNNDETPYSIGEGKGFDFEGYTIAVEAGLYLQPQLDTPEEKQINWPGIGVYVDHEDEGNCPFNGRIIGGVRIIKLLKGAPLFNYIGPTGHIDQLLLEDIISCTGNAAYVEVNEGVICASKVGSKKTNNQLFEITGNRTYMGGTEIVRNTTAPPAVYVGAFCAKNDGVLISCYSTANFKATNGTRIGGLVGLNNNFMLCCFAAGKTEKQVSGAMIHGIAAGAGSVVNHLDGKSGEGMTAEAKHMFCLYDRDLIKDTFTIYQADETTTEGESIPESLRTHGAFYNKSNSTWISATGIRAIPSLTMKGKSIVGMRDDTTSANQLTLNGTLATVATYFSATLPPYTLHVFSTRLGYSDEAIRAHLKARYYVHHIAEYPYVY